LKVYENTMCIVELSLDSLRFQAVLIDISFNVWKQLHKMKPQLQIHPHSIHSHKAKSRKRSDQQQELLTS